MLLTPITESMAFHEIFHISPVFTLPSPAIPGMFYCTRPSEQRHKANRQLKGSTI